MIKSRPGAAIAGIVLGAVVVAIALLSWSEGGPQKLRELTEPVAVPEMPR